MGDTIPLNIALQPSLATTRNLTPEVLTLPALLTELPENLQSLNRPISINGTLIGLLEGDELALKTALGNISLKIQDETGSLLKKFAEILKSSAGRPPLFEVTIQPGNPPSKATLMIPKELGFMKTTNDAQPMLSMPKGAEPLPSSEAPTPSLKLGAEVKVTILPEGLFKTSSPGPTSQTASSQAFQSATQFEAPKSPPAPDSKPAPTYSTPPKDAQGAPAPQSLISNFVKTPIAETATTMVVKTILKPQNDWPDQMPLQGEFRGTIIAKNPQNQPIIQTDTKTFLVQLATDLPEGTKIIGLLRERDPALPLLKMDTLHTATQELAALLEQMDPLLTRNVVAAKVPTLAQNFAGTVLFFLSALQSGKLDEWLGSSALDKITKSTKTGEKSKLVATLEEAAGKTMSDPKVGDWQSYPIPVHYGHELDILQLYVHHDRTQSETDTSSERAKRTRFVISMTMSRLGPIQLDGLAQNKQLDLVIRSENALPQELENSLRSGALTSLAAVGLVGSLSFQTGRQNWVVLSEKNTQREEWVT